VDNQVVSTFEEVAMQTYRTSRRFASLVVGFGASALTVAFYARSQQAQKPVALKDLTRYRSWTKINPEPVRFAAAPAMQCLSPSSSQQPSVHRDKFITVYVNPIGREAALRQKRPRFPVGTLLVKEKRAEQTSQTPELLTVMRKREPGFDAKAGDWEYFVLTGDAKKVTAQGKIAHCRACHLQTPETDFVYRNAYLPRKFAERLK
jgi:hypothetical protein